jgi:hypothetical protein
VPSGITLSVIRASSGDPTNSTFHIFIWLSTPKDSVHTTQPSSKPVKPQPSILSISIGIEIICNGYGNAHYLQRIYSSTSLL